MIRGTKNESIISATKKPSVTNMSSESYELVLGGADLANAVVIEKRQIDTPEIYQTIVPSGGHNGVEE